MEFKQFTSKSAADALAESNGPPAWWDLYVGPVIERGGISYVALMMGQGDAILLRLDNPSCSMFGEATFAEWNGSRWAVLCKTKEEHFPWPEGM